MQGRLLIKHAVGGRTFVDSAKDSTPFEVKEFSDGAGWAFEVRLPAGESADEIVKWRNELNVFVFEEYRQPVVKIWYYADGGSVDYDEATGVLRFRAASKIEYVPDEYTW